jgi:hypothetical protein
MRLIKVVKTYEAEPRQKSKPRPRQQKQNRRRSRIKPCKKISLAVMIATARL